MLEATGSVSSGEMSSSEEQNPSLSAGEQLDAASLKSTEFSGLTQSGQLRMATVTHHSWEAE